MNKRESNKTPEEIQRSEIRSSVKRLTDERANLIERIARHKANVSKTESYGRLDHANDEAVQRIESLSDIELDADWLKKTNGSQSCIWFGTIQTISDNSLPGGGSYRYKAAKRRLDKAKEKANKKVCNGKRTLLDVYCDEHRTMADQVLSKNLIGKKTHLIPSKNADQIKKALISELHYLDKHFQDEHNNDANKLEEMKIRVKEIDGKLAKLRDKQASIESQLKRKKLPENTRLSIYKKHNFKCAICKVDLTLVAPHIDHIVPLAKGGQDILSNLQPLCGPCNLKKGSKYEE
jgi:5-methylcytosine-specific restriction protein A